MANYTSVYTGQELDDSIKQSQQSIAAKFNSGTSYSVGNYCTYSGLLYKCKVACSGAWDASKWDAVTVTDELGDSNYIESVDTPFNVTDKQLKFANGYNPMTDTQVTKLAGIAANATKVEASGTNGKIKINGVDSTVYTEEPNTVHDASYKHISVTSTTVSDGTNTLTKYSHPAGNAPSQDTGWYKFATDATSHITSVTPVDGTDVSSKLAFKTAYNASSNKIATESDIAGIAGGMHFRGVITKQAGETDEQALARAIPDPQNGDIAIVESREYVYVASETTWKKFGDESAWDTKGSAAAAEAAAKLYADGKITALTGSATADTGYALSSITETNGIISKATQVAIPVVPTAVSAFTNDANYATQTYVDTAIRSAITDAIAASY